MSALALLLELLTTVFELSESGAALNADKMACNLGAVKLLRQLEIFVPCILCSFGVFYWHFSI